MSLKPPKKSDLDTSWMKARRDKPKKIQPEYHLIITEGTDTGPAYFGAIYLKNKACRNTYHSRRLFLCLIQSLSLPKIQTNPSSPGLQFSPSFHNAFTIFHFYNSKHTNSGKLPGLRCIRSRAFPDIQIRNTNLH